MSTARSRRANAQRWYSPYMRVAVEVTDAELAEIRQAQRDMLDYSLTAEQRLAAYRRAFPQVNYTE